MNKKFEIISNMELEKIEGGGALGVIGGGLMIAGAIVCGGAPIVVAGGIISGAVTIIGSL